MIKEIRISSNPKIGNEFIIGVRADFNNKVGFGHINRIINFLTLLNVRSKIFIFSNYNINNYKILDNIKKYKIFYVPSNNSNHIDFKYCEHKIKLNSLYFDYFIIDNYQINILWQKKIKKYSNNLIIFNDFIKKNYFCDIFINNNYGAEKYKMNIKNTRELLGNDYFIFPKKYNLKQKNDSLKFKINTFNNKNKINILIHFGSFNNFKIYKLILSCLESFESSFQITMLISDSKLTNKLNMLKFKFINLKFINYTNNIEKLYLKSHIAIGAGGVSMMERLFYNIPNFIFQVSNNQKIAINNLKKKKYIYFIGKSKLNLNILKKILNNYLYKRNFYINDVKNLSKIYKKTNLKTIKI